MEAVKCYLDTARAVEIRVGLTKAQAVEIRTDCMVWTVQCCFDADIQQLFAIITKPIYLKMTSLSGNREKMMFISLSCFPGVYFLLSWIRSYAQPFFVPHYFPSTLERSARSRFYTFPLALHRVGRLLGSRKTVTAKNLQKPRKIEKFPPISRTQSE